MVKVSDKTGEIGINTQGCKMQISEYYSRRNMVVQFLDIHGYATKTNYSNFVKGLIKNPYHPIIYHKGYIGVGDYPAVRDGKVTVEYTCWANMLKRCYNESHQIKYPTYIGCTVCAEWLDFQVFAQWMTDNYRPLVNERMELDKDLLKRDNKLYSPETCCFLPQSLNRLFTKRQNYRGAYPIGVVFSKQHGKFVAQCSTTEKRIRLRYRNTPEEAFQDYKTYKEALIKQKAEEYRHIISPEAYNALMSYEVLITD